MPQKLIPNHRTINSKQLLRGCKQILHCHIIRSGNIKRKIYYIEWLSANIPCRGGVSPPVCVHVNVFGQADPAPTCDVAEFNKTEAFIPHLLSGRYPSQCKNGCSALRAGSIRIYRLSHTDGLSTHRRQLTCAQP